MRDKQSEIYENSRLSEEEFRNVPYVISRYARKLEHDGDLDALMDHIGDARYVLLGEASHGTHEYYTWRMKLTQRLIEERNFSFVAVEGDWPDCYRLNRYAKGYAGAGEKARDVLYEFTRWPTWMWANWETAAFIEWLQQHNRELAHDRKIGFYGLDVYSLFESLESIINYLKQNDPSALDTAYQAMKCFDPYSGSEHAYAQALSLVPHLCESEVVSLLREIRNKIPQYDSDYENVFSTEQNAVIAVNAEKYYQAMLQGGAASWNVRDRHMASTLDRLMDFHGPQSKAVIWAHNTHIGDARATDMLYENRVNIGQLLTETKAEEGVILVGFGSYEGSVIAGRFWGDEMKRMQVPPAKEKSWENMLHQATGGHNKLILTPEIQDEDSMGFHLGHRAIGVVYDPEKEYGNYVPSIIPMRYDAFIYLDKTTAVHPIHIQPEGDQVPETYPFGV